MFKGFGQLNTGRRILRPLIMCLLGSMMLYAGELGQNQPARIVLKTTSGPVEGSQIDKLQVFRGIPYAAPPVSARRWRPPVPPTPWSEIRSAHEFGPACPQVAEPGSTEPLPSMSEDCLTINVWTPHADSGLRPVMVFIHGGAFMEGSTREKPYDGTLLAARGGIVVVTPQYRVGAFGFLELSDIAGKEFTQSGDLGILDQIAALRWVQQNIVAFGGNPKNVTILGESAGAVSVGTLLAAREARGLFHKAIMESPRAPYGHTQARATQIARQLMKLAGVSTFSELKALSTDQIMAAQNKLFYARFEDTSFSPVLDGVVIPEPTQRKIIQGHGANVPLIIGTNLEELNFWEYEEGLPLDKIPPSVLEKQLQPLLGTKACAAINLYTKGHPDRTQGEGIVTLLGDLTFRMPSIRIAESNSIRQPTWMYLFTYHAKYGAEHAAELPFVFGVSDEANITGTEQQLAKLTSQMQLAWINFAREGDPNHSGLPFWPKYDLNSRATMEFGLTSEVINDPNVNERKAWAGVPFDGITPDIDQASGLMTLAGGGKYWTW